MLLFVCLCLTLLGLAAWTNTRSAHRRAAALRLETNPRLQASAQIQTKPTLSNLTSLASVTSVLSTVSATGIQKTATACLTEITLAPLRRSFPTPRFTARTDLPPGRQTMLSNRLLLSPEVQSIPKSTSGQQAPSTRNTTPFILLFNTPVNDASRQLLTSLGAIVRGYFPNNALLAELTPAALAKLGTATSIQAAEEYLPSDKLQPFLASLIASQAPTTLIRTTIQTFAPEDTGSIAAAVRSAGGTVDGTSAGKRWGIVHATLPLSAIHPLTALGEVQWIEERAQITTQNNQAAIGTHLNTTNIYQTWNLTGKGQIVGHADTGLDTGNLATMHPDFQGRVLALIARGRPGDASDPNPYGGHGTHTAGSILGSGAASTNLYHGTAYEALLVHQSVMDANGYLSGLGVSVYALFEESYGYGARIHSDSWGSVTAGQYSSDCVSADEFAWDFPDHLAVFSAGNEGVDANSDGVIDLGSVGSPGAAKNVLTVGATENDRPPGSGGYSSSTYGLAWPSDYPAAPIRTDYISYSATTSPYRQGMAAFSSRGPTRDGRIKPDLVASGTDVISTKSSIGDSLWGDLSSNPRYCFCGGTSMSTPLVAGTVALMRQYAVERAGVTNPSAALLKAMLIGGARSLTPGQYGTNATREIPTFSPNNVEGWGQPDIQNTVHPSGRMVRLYDRITASAGATNTFSVTVTVSNTPLDIALVWIDYPATAGAGVTLVNDLDLLVTAPDGSTLYPNGGVARDSLNTVETLRVAAAQTGVYQVHVIGYAVPYSGGAAALYVRGTIDAPPVIVHTPLTAQIASSTPYPINFQVQNLTALTNGEARLFWTTGTASAATGAWQTVAASWTSNSLYQAAIPGQPPDTYIHYYLLVDTGAYSIHLPPTAPATNFSFYANLEVTLTIDGAPTQLGTVTPPYGTTNVIAGVPYEASAPAQVTLSNGIIRVCTGWTGTGDVPATGSTNVLTYTLNQNSSITWQWQNTPCLRVTPQNFPIFKLSSSETNASLMVSNFFGPDLIWTVNVTTATAAFGVTNSAWPHTGVNDIWHSDTNRTWNGDTVWYCGNQVTRYYPNGCHAWLNTPAFRVGTGGGLLFRHWIKTEFDTGLHFWDGAVLTISTNGGATFMVIEPVGGYPYRITDNVDSPFPANQPCLAGNGEGWQTVMVDLSAFAGQDVIFSFEFGSDYYTVEEGWYVANVTVFSDAGTTPAWLIPQGACGGTLPGSCSAPAAFSISPTNITYNEEAVACLRVSSNDPDSSPLVPLTVWRGHFLDAAAWGPGTASNDLAFLFRDAQANVTLRADTGAYLYCITINGVPQQGIYDFTTVTTNLAFANLDNDQSVIAWFGYRTWSLSIGTPYSTATPAAGAYTITNGTLINASVAAPLHSAENIRRDCSGWTLTGNTPATGSTNQLSFTLTNNATLVWNWNSNLSYKATALADANGAVSPTNAWYQHGVTAAITAYPSTYYHLLNWLGDTNGAVFYDTRMDLQMLGPRTVTSTFAPNLTTAYSVPEYWLAAYGWTQNFETAAATDADRDGMPTWAEWRADTDPTNRSSLLQLTSLQPVSNTCVLIWTGGSLSTQQVERADTPTGAWIQLYTNFPPTALTSSLSLPDNGSNSFYRIRIP